MSETQLTTSITNIVPTFNPQTGYYDDVWPYPPHQKPKNVKLQCGCCNSGKPFANKNAYEAHKKGIGHRAHFKRWIDDNNEKSALKKKVETERKIQKLLNREMKKLKQALAKCRLALAVEKEKNARMELELDDTQSDYDSDSDNDFEDAITEAN